MMGDTAIAIPGDLLAGIHDHARQAYPHECCGYLIGPAGGPLVAAIACHNALSAGHGNAGAPDPEHGYVLADAELLTFARSFDHPCPPRLVYHSHTHGHAYFSAMDRAFAAGPAYPVQHLVIGVTARGITEHAQFAWSDAADDYIEVARWGVP